MIVVLSLIFLYLLIQSLALFALTKKEPERRDPVEWPYISIWVAARNEEENIVRCLQSLDAMYYPKDRMQVLVGDDHSEDRTAELVREFIRDKPLFSLIAIEGNLGKAKKKANVLAQLAHHSAGKFYLICDADIQVKPTWAGEMVSAFSEGDAVISGTTLIEGKSWFSKMQRQDWLYFMGLIKSAAVYGIPCTAVGNNMAVSKEAYWATGGYENIDFSITEDYKLFREVIERDFGWKHLCSPGTTSLSAPAPTWSALINQRKRWLEGGRELPLYWKLLLGLFGGFQLLFVLMLILDWKIALVLLALQIALQSLFLLFLFRRISEKAQPLYILLYAPYSMVVSIVSSFYFLLPAGKEWKGRSYP